MNGNDESPQRLGTSSICSSVELKCRFHAPSDKSRLCGVVHASLLREKGIGIGGAGYFEEFGQSIEIFQKRSADPETDVESGFRAMERRVGEVL